MHVDFSRSLQLLLFREIYDEVLCTSICDHGGLFHLCELELCLNFSVTACECVRVAIYYVTLLAMHLWIFTCMDVFNGCLCACACVRLIALVTQAISHSHCSKLWVGEGHCGADRGDRIERGDGGWVGEKETEGDDNEKLKAARKWDVGLHSRAVVFAARKCVSPWGLELFLPLWGESLSFLCRGLRSFSLKPEKYLSTTMTSGRIPFILNPSIQAVEAAKYWQYDCNCRLNIYCLCRSMQGYYLNHSTTQDPI